MKHWPSPLAGEVAQSAGGGYASGSLLLGWSTPEGASSSPLSGEVARSAGGGRRAVCVLPSPLSGEVARSAGGGTAPGKDLTK
jgi:hypothetical protein